MSTKSVLLILIIIVVVFLFWFYSKKPTGRRDWSIDQAVLPDITIDGNLITIKYIRDFTYRTATDYDINYYDRTIHVNDVVTVDFIVEPFSGKIGVAHTFVSFGLKDGSYLSISVEVRKQKGESFSALKGLFRHFEIMYVIGSEADIVGLRANIRHDDVYLYPVMTTPEMAQKMFVSMITRADKLSESPEFYNTITNTCTTNLAKHINELVPGRIPWSYKLLLPTFSDKLAYDVGLLDNSIPFSELKQKSRINELSAQVKDRHDYSKIIRAEIAQ